MPQRALNATATIGEISPVQGDVRFYRDAIPKELPQENGGNTEISLVEDTLDLPDNYATAWGMKGHHTVYEEITGEPHPLQSIILDSVETARPALYGSVDRAIIDCAKYAVRRVRAEKPNAVILPEAWIVRNERMRRAAYRIAELLERNKLSEELVLSRAALPAVLTEEDDELLASAYDKQVAQDLSDIRPYWVDPESGQIKCSTARVDMFALEPSDESDKPWLERTFGALVKGSNKRMPLLDFKGLANAQINTGEGFISGTRAAQQLLGKVVTGEFQMTVFEIKFDTNGHPMEPAKLRQEVAAGGIALATSFAANLLPELTDPKTKADFLDNVDGVSIRASLGIVPSGTVIPGHPTIDELVEPTAPSVMVDNISSRELQQHMRVREQTVRTTLMGSGMQLSAR